MKTKYKNNDLLDFIMQNPMELREIIEDYEKINPIKKWIIKFLSNFY